MKTYNSTTLYGNAISEYGLENGYVDFGTVMKSFNHVLCNNIGKYVFEEGTEIVQSGADVERIEVIEESISMIEESIEIYEAELADIESAIDDLKNVLESLEMHSVYCSVEDNICSAKDELEERKQELETLIEESEDNKQELEDELEDLENYVDTEIFQYFIVEDNAVDTIKGFLPDYPLFYNGDLDVYILGVTHFGTAWSNVLTSVKLELEEN